MCNVNVTSNDAPLENIRDEYGHLEEVGFDVLMTNEEGDIANAEEGSHEENGEDVEEKMNMKMKNKKRNVEFSIEEDDDDC